MIGKLTRRDVIKQGAAVLAAYALNPPSRLEAATSFDLVIRGGTILDGTGGPPWSADLGIVMPEQFDEGLEDWRSGGLYPGEVEYRLTYKKYEGEPYPWLFVDPVTLADRARAAGLRAQVVARGGRGSFLARVSM